MKALVLTIISTIGAGIATYFGGWSSAMTTLCVFMLVDYVTGLITAGVFKNSPKTADGGIESRAGLKGLLRKFAMLLMVVVACRVDLLLSTTYVKDCVIIAFCSNELISIIENFGLMGIPLPKVITNIISVLQNKEGE